MVPRGYLMVPEGYLNKSVLLSCSVQLKKQSKHKNLQPANFEPDMLVRLGMQEKRAEASVVSSSCSSVARAADGLRWIGGQTRSVAGHSWAEYIPMHCHTLPLLLGGIHCTAYQPVQCALCVSLLVILNSLL